MPGLGLFRCDLIELGKDNRGFRVIGKDIVLDLFGGPYNVDLLLLLKSLLGQMVLAEGQLLVALF